MNDLISVVIPAYNIADCLSGCLDSVLAQTHVALEVIVVDDGSTDATAQVLDAYAEKDVRIKAIHKENGGVTSARLRGIAEATGEWIGFVDGDDYIEPTMFEHLLSNAVRYQADIAHCGYQMVFPNGRVDYYYNTGRLVQQDNRTGLSDLLRGDFVEPGLCNKLFHQSLFRCLLYDDVMPRDIKINEDLLMNYYLFKEAQLSVYEDFCPYHYMLRKGSAATSKLNPHKLKDPLKVLDKLYEDTAGDAQVQEVVVLRRVRHMINMATMRYQGQKDLIAPYRREVRKRLRREWKRVMNTAACPLSLKLMMMWAMLWPWSYSVIHVLHSQISGNAHKYDVE